jgi:16S rRNA (guanine1516-N2)-methyltransferase
MTFHAHTPTNTIAILAVHPEYHEQAQRWAQALALPIITNEGKKHFPLVLLVSEEGLALQQTHARINPVKVDFAAGSARHRRLYGGGKGQMLAKAVGVVDKANLRVVDATAGLGRDAFVLASLGCELTLIERSPIIFALLADGLARAQQDHNIKPIIARMELVNADARTWLQQTQQPIDVVYLDPMFPESAKAALVKKEMRIFHELIGKDEDADGLLARALTKAHYRVVVKRPRLAKPLAGQEPTYSLTGKANRFDVYVLKGIKKT